MSPPHGAPQHPLPRTSYLTASAPQRSGTVTPTSGSQTITSTPSPEPELVLRLRGAHEPATRRRRGIQWAEDVIDNEGLGRKKSKVCCIYHKERPVGESDSESGDSSSSSSDESASGEDTGEARMVGAGRRKGTRRKHAHDHDHDHDGDCAHGDEDGKGTGTAKGKRKASPNAYEKMPKYNVKKLHGGVVAGTKN